jgi:hypothetical protein
MFTWAPIHINRVPDHRFIPTLLLQKTPIYHPPHSHHNKKHRVNIKSPTVEIPHTTMQLFKDGDVEVEHNVGYKRIIIYCSLISPVLGTGMYDLASHE